MTDPLIARTPAPDAEAREQTEGDRLWSRTPLNVLIVVLGALIFVGSLVIGVLREGWTPGLTGVLELVATLMVVLPLLLPAERVLGVSRAVVVRSGGGFVGAVTLVNLGYEINSRLSIYGGSNLSVVQIIGGGILILGAWLLTNGDLLLEAGRIARIGGRPVGHQLVYLGGMAVVLAWLVLPLATVDWRDWIAIAPASTVLALAGLWVASDPDGDLRLPVASAPFIAACGVVTLVVALLWLAGAGTGSPLAFRALEVLGGLLFVVGAATLAVGGILGLRSGVATAVGA
jgi:hypothetical protein